MSLPNGPRLSDSIASKLIEGGFPVDLDGLRFNAALNIWEFVPFGGGGAATGMQWASGLESIVFNVIVYNGFDSIDLYVASFDQQRSATPFGATFQNMTIRYATNSLDGDTVVTFEFTGVLSPITITVGAGLTGTFSDLINTQVVPQLSLIQQQVDTTASTAGTSQCRGNSIGWTIP